MHTGVVPPTSRWMLNILTGVAIAETKHSLSVFVGCYSDISGIGGVGVVTSTHGLRPQRIPVKSGSTRVFGGSLLLTPEVTCRTTRPPTTTTTTMTTTIKSTLTKIKQKHTTTHAPKLGRYNLTLPVHRDQHKPAYASATRVDMTSLVVVAVSLVVSIVRPCR